MWEKVYNCRVADYHTYFVGLESWGYAIWAHNAYDTRSMVRKGKDVKLVSMKGKSPEKGTRQTGIDRAWKDELELIKKTGKGTAKWTSDEIKAIKNGASYKDLGHTGHHINKVSEYPEWQGDPRNIAFLRQGSGRQHMTKGHPGGTRAPQPPALLIDRRAMLDALS